MPPPPIPAGALTSIDQSPNHCDKKNTTTRGQSIDRANAIYCDLACISGATASHAVRLRIAMLFTEYGADDGTDSQRRPCSWGSLASHSRQLWELTGATLASPGSSDPAPSWLCGLAGGKLSPPPWPVPAAMTVILEGTKPISSFYEASLGVPGTSSTLLRHGTRSRHHPILPSITPAQAMRQSRLAAPRRVDDWLCSLFLHFADSSSMPGPSCSVSFPPSDHVDSDSRHHSLVLTRRSSWSGACTSQTGSRLESASTHSFYAEENGYLGIGPYDIHGP